MESGEFLEDPEALVECLRAAPGTLRWVAIAPDVEDSPAIIQQIRQADPSVSVVLLGDGDVALQDLRRILAVLGTEEDGDALRRPLDAQRRAFEVEKLTSITELTAGLAHDVATPMTAILGYAELIAKSVGDDRNRKRATTIVEQVSRVSDLIETLTNLSWREDRPPIPVDLGGIVDKALDVCRERFERRGIEILRDGGPAPRVLADPGRLHQAFLNLFLQASEAIAGGATLRVSFGQAGTGDAEVRVSHTRAAIDPDLRDGSFDAPLESGAHEIPRGLGLVVARALVEEHGGTFEVTSEPDGGAEFRLSFPRPEPGR